MHDIACVTDDCMAIIQSLHRRFVVCSLLYTRFLLNFTQHKLQCKPEAQHSEWLA